MKRHITASILLLLQAGGAWGQHPPPGGLKIVVVQGEGAFNDIRRKLARDPVVEVRDDNDRPVPGVQVVFTLPETGPGGIFAGGGRSYTTTSDANGLAASRGLKPNNSEGRFSIRVTASVGSRTGAGVISQSNTLAGGAVLPGQRGSKKWWLVLVASGATGGILAATRSGSAPPPAGPLPTVLSAGTVTVGGPR